MLEDLPLDDPATYEIFCKGFTSGVFQFESPGMRDILRRYQPSRIEDLTALNALYRPGPIQGGMVDDFIERKQGRKAVQYDLPELKDLLEETYGVIVYQEQVMQISNRLAGYSLGEADLLRRAMGKKKAEEMAKQRERFIEGALERGLPQKKVEKIFDLMEQFAGYGFNKSHSAAYAYLAFVTAYLKAHYPVDFMAALLTSETGNTAKVVKYINECREMGITVLPPDVNDSEWSFTPDGPDGAHPLRPGRGQEPGRNRGGGHRQGARRRRAGSARSTNSARSVDLGAVNRRMIESLIQRRRHGFARRHARARRWPRVDGAMEAGQRAWRDRESGQGGLFGEMLAAEAARRAAAAQRARLDRQGEAGGRKRDAGLLGHRPSARPLRRQDRRTGHPRQRHSGRPGEGRRSGALRRAHRHHAQAQPRRQTVGRDDLEDRNGRVEAMVFATSYERLAPQLVEDKAVLVTRPGAAGRECAAQDFGAGHRAAG